MTTEHSGPGTVVPKYNGVAAYDSASEPRQVLRNLNQSEALTVIEDDGGAWLKVRLPEGTEGFVRRDTITDFVAAPPPVARAAAPAPPPVAPSPPPAAPAHQQAATADQPVTFGSALREGVFL